MARIAPHFRFLGGMERTTTSLRADKDNFYTLLNLRQSRSERGILEQTPYFTLQQQIPQGTYYDGGSQTEPTASSVRLISTIYGSSEFKVMDYTVYGGVFVQQQTFYQTTYPAADTIYTGCRLVIENLTGLSITLGSTLDVEMTAPAVFRWRKNGGGYTAGLVPSTGGVSIDGGNATLYFLANAGFAGTETWSWTRTDTSYVTGLSGTARRTRPLPSVITQSGTFFIDNTDRLMVATRTSANALISYVISAGYRPVYGNFLTLFADKIVVLGAASPTWVQRTTRARILKWSDRSDYHAFTATDVNEADTYALPVSTRTMNDSLEGVGLVVINETLWVFTGSEVFYTRDEGLPLVFSFHKYLPRFTFSTIDGINPIIPCPEGAYVLTTDEVFLFDGSTFTRKWLKSSGPLVASNSGFGVYDSLHDELIIVNGTELVIFQTRYNTWYTRAAYFDASSPNGPTTITASPSTRISTILIGKRSRTVLIEDATWGSLGVAASFDSVGTGWTSPQLVCHLLGDTLSTTKEITETFVSVLAGAITGAYYATAATVQGKLYWEVCDNGVITGTTTTDTLAVTTANTASLLSYPRTTFRALSLSLLLVDPAAVKPVGNCKVVTLEPTLTSDNTTR